MKRIVMTLARFVATVDRVPGQETSRLLWFTAVENGDTNGDWDRDLSDAVYLLSYLYLGGPAPAPVVGELCPLGFGGGLSGDTNGDGHLDLSDAVFLLSWLFQGGPEPTPFTCADGLSPYTGSGGAIGGTDRPIDWTVQGTLGGVGMRDGLLVFSGKVGGLNVTHLGLSTIEFEVLAKPTSPTTVLAVGGSFVLTSADGNELHGEYTGGAADFAAGVYMLDSKFVGGTGRFEDATGGVHTDGRINVATRTFSAKNFGRISY